MPSDKVFLNGEIAIPFRYLESDMYNLVPSVGEINGLRSNYSFAMIPGEKRDFGNCDMEIERRKAKPPPEKRGDIARTYFYMNWAYPKHGTISNKNRKLFQVWNKGDPGPLGMRTMQEDREDSGKGESVCKGALPNCGVMVDNNYGILRLL